MWWADPSGAILEQERKLSVIHSLDSADSEMHYSQQLECECVDL